MSTTTSNTTTGLDTRSRSLRRAAVIGAVAATAVNIAVWAAGRAADVSFLVNPLAGQTAMQVDVVAVSLTTCVMFALGMGLFALAARRSDRWARAVLAAGILVAVGSAGGALSVAADTSTGALLASMHLLTGATFTVTASRARRKRPHD